MPAGRDLYVTTLHAHVVFFYKDWTTFIPTMDVAGLQNLMILVLFEQNAANLILEMLPRVIVNASHTDHVYVIMSLCICRKNITDKNM